MYAFAAVRFYAVGCMHTVVPCLALGNKRVSAFGTLNQYLDTCAIRGHYSLTNPTKQCHPICARR